MAQGIQHVQATQFFELPSSSARGVSELRNKKWLNHNLTCGMNILGKLNQKLIFSFTIGIVGLG